MKFRGYTSMLLWAMLLLHSCLVVGQNFHSLDAALEKIEKRIDVTPDSCLRILKSIHSERPAQLAKINFLTGDCWLIGKQIDSALACFYKAEALTGYLPSLRARLCFRMGRAWYDKLNIDKAKHYYLKSLSFCTGKDDLETKTFASNDLGILYFEQNQADSAIFYYKVSLNSAKELNDKRLIASYMNNISLVYHRQGNYEKAIEWQLDAIRIKEQLNDTVSLATSLNNVGALLIKVRKYMDANRMLLRTYRILTDRKNGKMKAFAASNLGISYKMLGNYDSAVYFYHKALDIYSDIGLDEKKGGVYTNLGALYESRRQYSTALGYMLKALALSRKLNKPSEVAIRSNNIGSLYLLMKQPDIARNYILEAQKIAANEGSIELSKDVFSTLANYYETAGKYKDALKWHKEFVRLNDSLFSENSQKAINELNIKYETALKEKEIQSLHEQQQIANLELERRQSALRQQRIILLLTIVIVLLITVAFYFGFNRYRLKQRHAQMLLERQQNELEQRMLLAQMNPHFIFNSLGSVQNFIGQNKPDLAQHFLANFSRLMRAILENSRRRFIPLEEEVIALKLYTELEKQRFGNRFTFTIDVQVDEPEFVMIPPMMVQPFVENAIIHGFKNEKVPGVLMVRYFIDNGLIACLIEDNGVGRRSSAAGARNDHVSLGSSVVSERIELFRQEFKTDASVVYTDLMDESGQPCGTKVLLHLPFQERKL